MRSIDPILLSKIKEQNQTIWNNAQPKMEVSVARAKSTVMDSTYWTVETIRQTTGLGDVSVAPRRFKAYGRPNRIYEIHVKDGEVITSIREYPDKLKEGFKNQFSLGLGTSVAAAFNGYWERYRKLWRLITDEKPWIFWADNNNVLWRQYWDDETTKAQLDTDVVRVRAIRAWKNVNIADKDQGIVVGYIKTDGTAWYRNYCQQAEYSYVWENTKQLTQFIGTGININLFITNDYRMGFIIEDNLGQIHWLVTPRNWAGMAIASEKIFVSIGDIKADLIKVNKVNTYHNEKVVVSIGNIEAILLYAGNFNEFTQVVNIDNGSGNFGRVVYFETKYELFNLDISDFKIQDTNGVAFIALSVTKLGQFMYSVEVKDFNNTSGDITLIFNGLLGINEAGYNFSTFNASFTPISLVPTVNPIPTVEVIWNE